ncbi:ShlB/FhaC/HecB family hemolysin secretion/activation protein [Novosphingobium sp. ERN07]|uniref:ShlB/FhaC/HecB family hemolysin secretion/activation protein n=1 Tax=Novosphingobium sp. ERN07 TaxID=2726187 RepID=UPI00145694CC|nr:ShlB/FhaC/HecB family hemolysin secretion/activation protein [Novosphingobium sp. ERN07]NLR73353.1 ShlB/FhaC/HecB family hemolysin secretion/activation protein [Novosphingobium sp. ERN07]
MKKPLFATIAGVAAIGISASAAQAQQAVQTRDQLDLSVAKPDAPQATARVRSDGIEAGPCPLATSDIRTTIASVEITAPGGAALPGEIMQLLGGITPAAGEQPIRQVCDLRDEVQARLRAARYVASVQVPQQRIDSGVLKLEVVSGRIVEMRVRGDVGPYEAMLQRRIERLKELDPLNEAEAERILLLANDIPGLSVELALSPASGRPGDLIGELSVSFRSFSLLANLQNYNADFLGRETALLHAEFYGLTGQGDITTLTGQSTFDFKEQRIAALRHAMILNNAGTTMELRGTVAEARPDLLSLDQRTVSLVAGLGFSHPLLRTVTDRVKLSGGFEYSQQRSRFYQAGGGSSPLTRDRISALYLRLEGSTAKLDVTGEQRAGLSGSLELRRGIDVFGASRQGDIVDLYGTSRSDGSSLATVVRGSVEAFYKAGPVFELAGKVNGQWANRALLNYDTYAIGNFTIGRGYDPGANTGDRAIGFVIEPRLNFTLDQKVKGQVYGFYEGVKLWNIGPNATEKERFIASVGGGGRLSLSQAIRLDVTYTHALDKPLLTGAFAKRPKDRVLVSMTFQFVPFSL